MGGGAWGREALAGVGGGEGETDEDGDGESAASSHESARGVGTRGLGFVSGGRVMESFCFRPKQSVSSAPV